MIRDHRSNTSQSTTLVVLLAGFALLVGLYYSMRFGGWSMEGDASSYTTAGIGMLESGKLEYPGAYNNGFGYSAQLAIVSQISGFHVQDIQLGSSLWVFVIALVAFITCRELLGSPAIGGLAVTLLFLQPDFLFYIVRGGHEKYIWTYGLLMLFLLARSYHHKQKPLNLLIYIGLFYIVFWAFVVTNVYFATSFMSAILLSFIGGWALSRFGRRNNQEDKNKTQLLQRLTIITLACIIMVYVFINYTYSPAFSIFYYFNSLVDKLGLMVLGTQPVESPASYQYLEHAWLSQPAYLILTGLQWLIALVSLFAWGMRLTRLASMDQKHWLVWLMYSAFGVLLLLGVVADFAGFLSSNNQLRIFTPFAMFSSALVADLIARGFQALAVRWQKIFAITAVVVVICGAATVVLKTTNDPAFGNQWLFYTPAELAPSSWISKNHILDQDVWTDTSEHLARVYYFWEGYRPAIPYQYRYGMTQSTVSYTLISELTRLRANRSGISLPETDDQNRVYDNGTVEIYHRRPLTPYQR